MAGTELTSQQRGTDTHFYLKDGQGSTRLLVNASGSLLNTYGYNAFGDFYAPQTAGTTPNTYLYTGQQYDALTGNYSLRARYYDPGVGRFLSRDKFPYNYQKPFELNRYSYAANNPITHFDPSGLSALLSHSEQNETSAEQAKGLQTSGIILNFAQGSYKAYTYSLYTKTISALLLGMVLSSLLSLLLPYVPPAPTPDQDTNNPPGHYNPPHQDDSDDSDEPSTDPNDSLPSNNDPYGNPNADADAPPLPDSAPEVE